MLLAPITDEICGEGRVYMQKKNLAYITRMRENNLFPSHHHKYIDTFSIKFNYLRHKDKKEWHQNEFSLVVISMHIFTILFKSLTRSSNNLSQLNQFLEIWCPFLLLRHLGDLHGTGMRAIFFYIFYSFNNSWPFFALFFFKSFMHFNATLMIV